MLSNNGFVYLQLKEGGGREEGERRERRWREEGEKMERGGREEGEVQIKVVVIDVQLVMFKQ